MVNVANEVRNLIEVELSQKEELFGQKEQDEKIRSEQIDITLPGYSLPEGSLHPITLILQEVKEIFVGLGFTVVEGPEIENRLL